MIRLSGMALLTLSLTTVLYAQAGEPIAHIFKIQNGKVEIFGPKISKLARGQALVVKKGQASIRLTVTEIFHSKANCKIVSGAGIQANDPVYLYVAPAAPTPTAPASTIPEAVSIPREKFPFQNDLEFIIR